MVLEQELIAVGRVIFGAYFAISGLNHFMMSEQLSGWVKSKNFPAPDLLVYFSGGQLIFGGLGVAFGILPVLSTGALASFLLVATPLFHNFWKMGEDQKQEHMINFLKNVALIGGLLMLLGASATLFDPYSAGITLLG